MKCYNTGCDRFDKDFTLNCDVYDDIKDAQSMCVDYGTIRPCLNCGSRKTVSTHKDFGVQCTSCGRNTGKCKTLDIARKQWNGE